jgi:hypothetical protein
MNALLTVAILALGPSFAGQQEKPASQEKPANSDMASCPMHEKHSAEAKAAHDDEDHRHKGVVERGDQVMGFSHETTKHHFRIYVDGGAIEAEAKDAKDTQSRDAIRAHFAHIAKLFAHGDFSIPMLIHAQEPPGAEAMKRLRAEIDYKPENMERGGRIRITTKNAEALEAIHSFLRFQITDHQTGDSLQVSSEQ